MEQEGKDATAKETTGKVEGSEISPPSSDIDQSHRSVIPAEFVYPQRSGRGCALIIGNSFKSEKFEKQHWREQACTKDLENMGNLWQHFFGCDLFGGQVHKDKTASEMTELLKGIANNESNHAFVVIAISTHGGSKQIEKDSDGKFVDCLLGNDGISLDVRKVHEFFRNDKGVQLQGIPKLFLLQYCRGGLIDRGVLRKSTDTIDAVPNYDEPTLLPTYSDIATVFATQASYAALRNDDGSWLLSFIHEVFRQHANDHHVMDLLMIVNNRMKRHTGGYKGVGIKAMSIVESSFTKILKLKPVTQPREEQMATDY